MARSVMMRVDFIAGSQTKVLTRRCLYMMCMRYHMKQAIDSLRRENREMKLLQEIALQLRELRGMEQKEWHLSDFLPQTLRFQVGVAKAGSSICKKRRCNSTPRGSSCRPGTGLSRISSRLLLGLSLDGGNHTPCSLVS